MLIKCNECGKEVSDKAAECPHCGNPFLVLPELPPVTPATQATPQAKITFTPRPAPQASGQPPTRQPPPLASPSASVPPPITQIQVNVPPTKHVTIEKTSKELKGQQVVAAMLACAGTFYFVVGVFGGYTSNVIGGGIMGSVGLVWWAILKAKVWWHHG